MSRWFSATGVAVVLVALVACTASSPTRVEVRITDSGFSPAQVTTNVGATVMWTNDGNTQHTVTMTDSDSGGIAQKATYSYEFDAAGTYDYYCRYHPQETGTVTVR